MSLNSSLFYVGPVWKSHSCFSHDVAQKCDRQLTANEPRHEKTGFLPICENKGADQLCSYCTADQHLCFCYPDSTIPPLVIPKMLRFQHHSVAAQPGLCKTWSETPKTGFLASQLKSHCCTCNVFYRLFKVCS